MTAGSVLLRKPILCARFENVHAHSETSASWNLSVHRDAVKRCSHGRQNATRKSGCRKNVQMRAVAKEKDAPGEVAAL
jgi:hypothetical protein